jgi:hypothetical protein
MQKPLILIDLDCTIRNKPQAIIDYIFNAYGVRLGRENFDVWDPPLEQILCAQGVSISRSYLLERIWGPSSMDLDMNSRPFDHAVSVIKWLKKHFRVGIATGNPAPPWATQAWLQHHDICPDEIITQITTPDKLNLITTWNPIALIDDNPNIIKAWQQQNDGPAIIPARMIPWNQGIETELELTDWTNIEAAVEPLICFA